MQYTRSAKWRHCIASAREGMAGWGEAERERERERDAELACARLAARPNGPRGAPAAGAGGSRPRKGAAEAMAGWGGSERWARALGGS